MTEFSAHPLLGRMARLAVWQIEAQLQETPPTPEQAGAIADEERKGQDRSDVYRALARWRAA